MVFKGESGNKDEMRSSKSPTNRSPHGYENLGSDEKPLAGILAGSVEYRPCYENLGTKYENVRFNSLPLAGEFVLLGTSGVELRYNKLKVRQIRRNSFGGITEDGRALYDKLNHGRAPFIDSRKRSNSVNDFRYISRARLLSNEQTKA